MLDEIHTQHWGQARDFRRRVMAEDAALVALSRRLVHPLVARIKRHPRRGVRAETISGLIRNWREMAPVIYSLDFAVSRTRHGCVITERRICGAEMSGSGDGPVTDRVVSVSEVTVSIDRNQVRQDHTILCLFPLRALAGRIRWCGYDDAGMIRAIDAASRSDVAKIAEHQTMEIPAQDGVWHARALQVEIPPGVPCKLIRCHAWVPVL